MPTIASKRALPALILLLFAPALAPGAAHAQGVYGPRTAAMGGAHRAVASSNDTVYLNPAGMSLYPRYTLETFFRRSTGRNENVFSASIVDSRSGAVAAGLAYTYERSRGGDTIHDDSRVELASSYAIAPFLLFGATLRYVGGEAEGEGISRVTGDTGFLIVLGKTLFVGITAQNVINPVDEGDVAPRGFGGGVGLLLFDSLQLAADWRIVPSPEEERMVWMFGAEYFAYGVLALRGGYLIDDVIDEQRWSVGIGYVDPGFGLDLSYERPTVSDHPGHYLAAGIRLFF